MLFPRVRSLLLLATAMAIPAWGDDQEPDPTVPLPAGLVATLKLPPAAVIGDHVRGEFVVKNVGSEPVRIRAGEHSATLRAREPGTNAALDFCPGEELIDPWLQVHVWNERGKPQPDLIGGAMFVAASKPVYVTLAPGEVRTLYCPLERYVAILRPDLYTISVWNDLGWQADPAHPPLMATAEIEFKPPNAPYITARIRALCAKDTEENTWELMHFWSPLYLTALRDEARAGRAPACLGMSGIMSEDANRVLLELAESKDSAVARAAIYALSTRLPSLVNPDQPALRTWNGRAAREWVLHTWQPKFDAPLMSAVTKLLERAPLGSISGKKGAAGSGDSISQLAPNSVSLGARIVEARGSSEEAPALLAATDRALELDTTPRKGPEATFAPPPLDALIRAIDTLRARGWRTDGHGGGGAQLAWFRQLADPRIPKPADGAWQDQVRMALGSKSPFLRESAILATPQPLADAWEPLLRAALEDADAGVVRAACAVAGDSHRKSMIGPLVGIIVNAHQPAVQVMAAEAAERLGAGVPLWTALCDVLPQPAMTADALQLLLRGTMNAPPGQILVDGNLKPEEAIAIRDAWKKFIEANRDLLDSGQRVPRGDPSITPRMMAAIRTAPER